MISTVNSTAQLSAVLKTAAAGDVIQLAPGVYSHVVIQNLSFAQGVTVTSLDPARPAVLTGLSLKDVQGMEFKSLEFRVDPGADFKVVSSQNIHFSKLHVHGSLDNDPKNDTAGLMIRGSRDVSVSDSEFQQLEFGLTHLDSGQLVFRDNQFHDLRLDGIRGGGSSDVLIEGNVFRDFYPNTRDHPDAIQFWTANTTTAATNIIVRDNVFQRGAGEEIQGIFFRDQVGNLPYENVAITGNLILGGTFNGISVNGGRNVRIEGNTVEGFIGQKSWVRVVNVEGATLRGNAANEVIVHETASKVVTDGNTLLSLSGDGGAATLSKWLALKGQPGNSPANAVQGDGGHNLLHAGNGDTVIRAGAGNDTVEGGAGHDHLSGEDGNDVLRGAGGNDTLDGAAGRDLLRGGDGDDVLRGGAGADDLHGNAGADTVSGGDGDDWVVGGKDNDRLTGDVGNDIVYGNAGDDAVDGGAGNDTVRGGAGDDTVRGGAGDDWLSGDRGTDQLVGGAGADVFHFSQEAGKDRVLDFNAAEGDRVQLSAGIDFAVAQSGAHTVISLSSGDQLILENVQMSTLPEGWLFSL